jgi:iron-sulfur cluster repair protein YtfE (RIC family)
MTSKLAASAVALLIVAGCSNPVGKDSEAQAANQSAHQPEASVMFQTPESIAAEHRELHEVLAGATKEPGELGAAARNLEAALAPHFKREEQIATPPLGLLDKLAHGPATAEMRGVLPMTDALEAELPKMLKEHEGIKAKAAAFRAAAVSAKRDEYVRFADTLAAHARQEEQILYPAAIVVGRYVKATAPQK